MNIKFKRTEIEIFYNNVKVFNVRFYQFIASSLNKCLFLSKKYLMTDHILNICDQKERAYAYTEK